MVACMLHSVEAELEKCISAAACQATSLKCAFQFDVRTHVLASRMRAAAAAGSMVLAAPQRCVRALAQLANTPMMMQGKASRRCWRGWVAVGMQSAWVARPRLEAQRHPAADASLPATSP